jgi:hypothetical protein
MSNLSFSTRSKKYGRKYKAIVKWNTKYALGSSPLYTRISKYVRSNTYMSNYHRSIIIGILLGDAHIRKLNLINNNARIIFKQFIINFPCLWHVYMELFPYCNSYPNLDFSKIGSKKYCTVVFRTRNYPFLNELYDIFILNGKKIVPLDIFNYLTPVAIAHWIMCDGASAHGGLILCTNSFKIEDVVLLMNVLLIKWDIKSVLHFSKGLPRIYINRKEKNKLKLIIFKYIILFFEYKLL